MKYFVNKFIPMSEKLPDLILLHMLQNSVDIEFEAPGAQSIDTLSQWTSENCQNLFSVTRLNSNVAKFYFFDKNDHTQFVNYLKSIA